MKLSENWIREWVNPPVDTKKLAEQLTMAGLEIDSIEPVAGEFEKVVIGLVKSAEQHPEADRLRVCKVDIGHNTILDIVCGGANVREGLKVPVVLVGGNIKGNLIKEAKLRGKPSQGMICSEVELGLQETSQGIMELPADAPTGKDFREWMKLSDHILDVHLTPNRGDCLSVLGIAREIAVINHLAFKNPLKIPAGKTVKSKFIQVEAQTDCPRYFGRHIKNINLKAKTPIEMQERLRRSGIRSISPIVDITNYVMLELGQPLHAFDYQKINSGIVVRRAKKNEKIILLNQQEVVLDENILVIADSKKPIAIAGIMGGLESAVTTETTEIFLESAFFNPLTIAGRARKLGLNTDSSYRFERGVDFELPKIALERATQLILEIMGGEAGHIEEVTHEKALPKREVITLRMSRIEKLLGIIIKKDDVEKILKQLGFHEERHPRESGDLLLNAKKYFSKDSRLRGNDVETEKALFFSCPSYRFDISIEADLIEEVARIYSYNKIPLSHPLSSLQMIPQSEKNISMKRIRNFWVDRGYHEAITYSFGSTQLQSQFHLQHESLNLANPISADLAVMRTTLWTGLLNAVAYNQNRQQNRVRLFETGLRFLSENNELKQDPMLAGVATGTFYSEQWGDSKRPVDFYDLKADLEALFVMTGEAEKFRFVPEEHPALHPGKSAAIYKADKKIGYLGGLHPRLIQSLDLIAPVYCFEMELEAITHAKLAQSPELSKFPSIRRDLSFWISREISAEKLLNTLRSVGGEWMQDVFIFDIYYDKQKNADQHSVAVGMTLQHPTRTLVDDEVNNLLQNIITKLQNEFQIKLRD